jgi:hypothetical protein
MRIFKALSHTKTLPIGRYNFSNPTNSKQPTVIINIINPKKVEVSDTNYKPLVQKKDIPLDDLSRKELQQLLDFVV